MSPERPSNYSEIGKKLQSNEEPSKEVLKVVLEKGLEFSLKLIDKYPGISANYDLQTDEFRQYFPYVILLRLAGFYQDSLKRDLKEAKSVELFKEFEKYLVDKFGISESKAGDEQFEKTLINTLNAINNDQSLFPEDILLAKIGRDINMIRTWVVSIVPNNPRPDTETSTITHPLD
ncbi:hypothetical protein A2W13_03470 [Candidatus Woesebacteria bacterium RBG_16_36_11]|uniref:Uncharacterized protein n=1 Tax=Candidatus Woesebacteria bacterium RBG_16_36_11 TaxID=1802481 RepID=A0A1F7X9V6_9BACT|nr:MAG: hypothetical protein A2W13_03470 [Candidatus Woesebacteria bacterium RBG_16_36_11]